MPRAAEFGRPPHVEPHSLLKCCAAMAAPACIACVIKMTCSSSNRRGDRREPHDSAVVSPTACPQAAGLAPSSVHKALCPCCCSTRCLNLSLGLLFGSLVVLGLHRLPFLGATGSSTTSSSSSSSSSPGGPSSGS
eukprot:gnl/TRDRNA2_/TRDRNA2_155924_c1_seq4.p1 gnl/TRDRNA2_/TRDRNA2_155924_c1~~gnl/TRDRNA2_/TRDRNA2_155924_c1_seq4.p1  ORF type:complete len:135 (-),score=7.25 gnl/TRDRNA2_/TRDRNA2_155924_c1_seq4:54-458(-)